MLRSFIAATLFILLPLHMAQANEQEVRDFADNLAQQALAIAKAEESGAEKEKKIQSLFRSHVNIEWVARFVAGKHWRNATDEQKQDFMKYYEAFLLKNYASKLKDYSGQTYNILNTRDEGDGEYVLAMELVNKGEPNVLIDYRLRKEDGGYQVIDIVVEGVSMITTQRSEFSSVISQKGFDYLISALKKKAGLA